MSTAGAAPAIVVSPIVVDGNEERTVVVYNCSRLGRTANPPGFSLRGFLDRFRRRR